MTDSNCSYASQAGVYEDEINLRELFLTLWNSKGLICLITAAFVLMSVAVALSQPNIFRAQALLAPVAQQEAGGGALSNLTGQFGGLASLAGINLNTGSSVDKTTLAIETMKSHQFLANLIEQHDVLVPLFATKSWSAGEGGLVIDSDVYNVDTGQWQRDVNPPFTPTPSLQEAHRVFSGIFTVEKDPASGMVHISVEHKSPYVAAEWVTWLVEDVNAYMKQRDIAEAQKSISFLQRQIELTPLAEMKQMLFGLIQEQIRTITLAEVRDEYVLRTIDPALPPEKRASPNRKLIVIVGALLGGMLACLFVLLRQAFRP